MGATYTRQSSTEIVDGEVINAADFNNEFAALVTAFAASTGHSHDGTTAEGGNVTKLLGTAITIGDGSSGTDITVTFDGETNDGALKWMEDEDYFEFSDDILVATTEKVQFRDTAIYINSSTDGQLDLVADTEIQIAATTIDINGNVEISGDLTVSGDDITMGTNTDTAIMVADGTNYNPVVPSGDITLTNAGVFGIASGVIVNADINASAAIADSKLDTISTAGKVDIGALEIDGATDIGADLVDADLMIVDDGANGTERKSTLTRVKKYIYSAMSGDATASDAGALTIANDAVEQAMIADDAVGADQLAANAVVNASIASGAAIADSKLATISTADKVSGAAIQIDGATDGTSITVAASDKFLIDDGGTTKYINASQLNTYVSAESSAIAADNITAGDGAVTIATTSGNITIDAQAGDADIIFKGTDDSSDITALTLDMSAAGAATFNDKIIATELDISGDVDVDGTLEADAITVNGSALNTVIAGVTVTNATTAVNATHVSVADNENTNEENLIPFIEDASATGNVGLESDGDFAYNPSTGTVSATIFKGNIDAVDGDFDGTLETDALSIGGTTVGSTAAELNLLDGSAKSTSSITVADSDAIIIIDGTTTKQIPASDIKTYAGGASVGDATALAIALG